MTYSLTQIHQCPSFLFYIYQLHQTQTIIKITQSIITSLPTYQNSSFISSPHDIHLANQLVAMVKAFITINFNSYIQNLFQRQIQLTNTTMALLFLLLSLVSSQSSPISNCQYYKVDSANITRCTICASPYQLNLNYTKCLPCSSLHPYCTRCDNYANNSIYCQACIDNYQIINNQCVNIDGCADPHCNSCSSPNHCLICNVGYYLKINASTCSPCPVSNQIDQGDATCACDSGTFLSSSSTSTSTCTNCEYPCQTCAKSAIFCTQCIYGYFLPPDSNGHCSLCLTPNCIICKSSSVCLNCTFGYQLVNGVCEIQLQQQNIENYINLPQFYYFCQPGCFYCYKYDFCITCLEGYSRNLFNDVCQKCSKGCKRCESLANMQCFSCYDGYTLTNSACVKCEDINCINCNSNSSVCISCAIGYTAANGSCQLCAKNCKKCGRAGSGGCDEGQCFAGYARVSNTACALCALGCYSCSSVDISTCISCPIGSFQVAGGQCKICPASCITCQSSSSCSTCRYGYQLVNNLCYEDCSYPCLQCSPYNARICSSCFDGYLLNEDMTCQPDTSCNAHSNCTICPVGHYLNLYSDLCLPCQLQQHCIKCETEAVKCAICAAGFYLIQNSCLACADSCLTCQLQTYCFSCRPGFFLSKQEGQAYGECIPCASSCLTCVDEARKCNSCNYSQQLIGFDCLSSQNIIFQLTLQDPSLPSANAEEYAFIKQIVAFTNQLAQAFGPPYSSHPELLYLKDISTGSIQVSYMATVDGLDPRVLLATISAALDQLSSFGGFTVISTQVLTNGFQSDVVMQPDPSYFYVALAPSPLFLVFVAFAAYRFLQKESYNKEYEEKEGLEVRLQPVEGAMETQKNLKGDTQGAITL